MTEFYMKTTLDRFSNKTFLYSETKEDGYESVGYAFRQGYSDCEPFEIVQVHSGKLLTLRGMNSVLIKTPDCALGGFVGHFENCQQRWDISPDYSGSVFNISLRKNGKWKRVGQSMSSDTYYLTEEPFKFYDFNF